MNIAYHDAPHALLLVGFDMGPLADDPRAHFFGEHPPELRRPSPYPLFIRNFGPIAADLHRAGIHCVDCSPARRLPMFEQMPLADAVARYA